MPYKLQEADGGWFVVKASDGTRMSKKPLTRARALAQLRALEINVVKPEEESAKSRKLLKKTKKPVKQEYPKKTFRSFFGQKEVAEKGGPGSGNFGHAGRPGKVGGSAAASGGGKHNLDLYGKRNALHREQSEILSRAKRAEGGLQLLPEDSKRYYEISQELGKVGEEIRIQETPTQESIDAHAHDKKGNPKDSAAPFKDNESAKLQKLLNKDVPSQYASYWQGMESDKKINSARRAVTERVFKRMGGWESVPKEVRAAAKRTGYAKSTFVDLIHGALSGSLTKDKLINSSRHASDPRDADSKTIFDYLGTLAWSSENKESKKLLKESLTVFKEKDTDKYRWLAISSSAFRDDDKEIVSMKALEQDVENSDKTGEYGTLRWWHVPNLDIGTCDFRMMAGQMLVESGTFTDNRVGKAFKEAESPMQMSIGFYHPVTEPDGEGVYSNIKVFERSVMPKGFAANRFTKFLTTKGA